MTMSEISTAKSTAVGPFSDARNSRIFTVRPFIKSSHDDGAPLLVFHALPQGADVREMRKKPLGGAKTAEGCGFHVSK
jgi:hypothetical protein